MSHINQRVQARVAEDFTPHERFGLWSTLGIFVALVGTWVIWRGERNDYDARRWLQTLTDAIVVDDAGPIAEYAGQPRLVTETLSGRAPLDDEYLHPGPWLILERSTDHQGQGAPMTIRQEAAPFRFGYFDGATIFDTLRQSQTTRELALTTDMLREPNRDTLVGNRIMSPAQSSDPQQIRYRVLPSQVLTVVGQQEGHTLTPWVHDGKSLGLLVAPGRLTLSAMRSFQERRYTSLNHVHKGYGLGLLWLAWAFLLVPFRGKFRALPALGRYPRMMPLLLTIGTMLALVLVLRSYPYLFVLLLTQLSIVSGALWFIAANREVS